MEIHIEQEFFVHGSRLESLDQVSLQPLCRKPGTLNDAVSFSFYLFTFSLSFVLVIRAFFLDGEVANLV